MRRLEEVKTFDLLADSPWMEALLMTWNSDDNRRQVRAHEVRDATIVLELHYPLAGKILPSNMWIVEFMQD